MKNTPSKQSGHAVLYVQKASDIAPKSSVLTKHLQKSSVCIFKEIIHAQF